MKNGRTARLGIAVLATTFLTPIAHAGNEAPSLEELKSFKETLEEQGFRLREQQDQLEQQEVDINTQQRVLRTLYQIYYPEDRIPDYDLDDYRARGAQPSATDRRSTTSGAAREEGLVAQVSPGSADAGSQDPETVGQSPDRESDPSNQDISIIQDVGGVLTPRNNFVMDVMTEYSHSSDNRFFFQGVQIVDAVLIGVIEATSVERDVVNASIGGRFGLTDRLEIDARVPFQYRSDHLSFTPIEGDPNTSIRDISGEGLGDVEVGLHYQVNRRRGKFAYMVLNVRVKTDTGKGPFEVSRDSEGVETELPSGSGFIAVEPSATLILPSDPVVLFANVGYLLNLAEDVNAQIGTDTLIRRVNPGNAVKVSVGAGVAFNDKLSMSFGYEHSYVMGTSSNVGVRADIADPYTFSTTKSRAAQVGSLLWGLSYILNERTSVNFNVGVGVTEDAQDMRVLVRVPIKLYAPE